MSTKKTTKTTVADLHASVAALATEQGIPELRFPQKLRASAAGAVFAACRPAFTEDDEDDLGYVLGQLAGWVLHGEAYDPDLPPAASASLKGAA